MGFQKNRLGLLLSGGLIVVATVAVLLLNRSESGEQAPGDTRASLASAESEASSEFRWVRDLAMESVFDPPLTLVQQETLAEQCESIMSVYMNGDADDYLAMIDSWGGWLRESYEVEDIQRRWTQATHKFPWAEIERKKWAVGRTERAPEDGAIDHTNEEFDGLTAIQSSLFDFGDDRKALNQDYNALVSFQGTARSADGSRTYVHMLFLWSPSLGRWLPATLVNQAQEGDSLPRVVF